MNKCILLLIWMLANQIATAQQQSYFKFIPEFSKDTLEIVNIDSLQFDIVIRYWKDEISMFSIVGKIGFINKYAIENPSEYYTLFSPSEKALRFGLPAYGILKKAASSNLPNMIDYEIDNYRGNVDSHGRFSEKKIDSVIQQVRFPLLTFRLVNRYLLFINEQQERDIKDMNERLIAIFLSKRNLRKIFVYDEENRLLLSKDYHY